MPSDVPAAPPTVTAAIPAAPMDVPATISAALAEPEIASLDAVGLDRVFREARTFSKWSARQVSDEDLRALYENGSDLGQLLPGALCLSA